MSLKPNWSAPKSIHAITLTNIDEAKTLLPHNSELKLLNQVHQNHILDFPPKENTLTADGVYTSQPNIVCAIKTADCLAILLCNEAGNEVAALHGGWRGLSQNIIAAGIKKFQSSPKNLIAWLSPAICPTHYEIDAVVYNAFIQQDKNYAECFTENRPGHWLCDLFKIAEYQLRKAGVTKIFCERICTFENENLYSFRRDPSNPNRLIHCIWIN